MKTCSCFVRNERSFFGYDLSAQFYSFYISKICKTQEAEDIFKIGIYTGLFLKKIDSRRFFLSLPVVFPLKPYL